MKCVMSSYYYLFISWVRFFLLSNTRVFQNLSNYQNQLENFKDKYGFRIYYILKPLQVTLIITQVYEVLPYGFSAYFAHTRYIAQIYWTQVLCQRNEITLRTSWSTAFASQAHWQYHMVNYFSQTKSIPMVYRCGIFSLDLANLSWIHTLCKVQRSALWNADGK